MFSPLVVVTALILDAIMGCAYLAYSATLIKLSVTVTDTRLARVFLLMGCALFIYSFFGKGSLSDALTSISDTSIDKGKTKVR